jgi:magnesium transporter
MTASGFYHFSTSGLFYRTGSVQDALSARKDGGFIWLDFYNPSKEELSALIEPMGIHPLSVEDSLDRNQVPKIEHFPGNTFIIFNSFTYSGRDLLTDELDIFIGKDFLITVSGVNSEGRVPLQRIPELLVNNPQMAAQGPSFLLHVILDNVVDEKFLAFEALEDDIEDAEERVLEAPASFMPHDLIRLRKNLVHLRKGLFHEREILVKICRKDCPYITEASIYHFRDVYDHLSKAFELTETYRDLVTSLMELYSSLLNNIITKTSNKTNDSVRRLTLIATVFMPLTLIASIGGMSEWSMITGPGNWRISYPLFFAGMVFIATINYLIIKSLERRSRMSAGDGLND